MEQNSFGYWLRLKRKALDLTREQLAERVGYSAATLRKIEDEERRPSVEIAQRLADVFRIAGDERESFVQFARGDSKRAPTETTEAAPWHASTKIHRSNIPATTTSLIARHHEISQVREYLSQEHVRLVTLMGPPGIGKTRLSIETARAVLSDFADGVFFVGLASLEDPHMIASAMIRDLGYIEGGDQSPVDQLKGSIASKQMLIVLDNCEHLIEEVTSIASGLLAACPRLKMLATSRESFRIAGEWLYLVPAFDIPKESEQLEIHNISDFPALTLFAERARAVQPAFKLTDDNIRTIAQICAHLDGLPLAIELIAGRMRLMSPQALLKRLSGQFVLSADGMRAASERQKTLRNAIDWSFKLLTAQEQKLFAWLSVFAGGFTLLDAEVIFGPTVGEKSISELFALLQDKSLIQRVVDPQNEEDGYQMLVTIHEYARQRLQQSGEEAEVRNWHLAYFRELARQADKNLRGLEQLEWLHRLDDRRDNLRAALNWAIETGQTEIALQMAGDLSWFWNMRSEFSEGRLWLEQVVQLPDAQRYPRLYSFSLAQLALLIWLQSGSKDAKLFVEQALSTARTHNEKRNIAWALSILGLVLTNESDLVGAQFALEESKALFQHNDDEWGYAYAICGLAAIVYTQGDLATSLALQEEGLVTYRKLGDKFFENATLRNIGIIQIKQGNLTRGVGALREALLIAQQLDSKQEIAWALIPIGDAAQAAGHTVRAIHLYLASKNVLDAIGAWRQDDEAELENTLASCREALSELEFMEAVEKGRAMTMEQAITYVLENMDE